MTCTTDTYALRGTASGLSGSGLVITGAFDGGAGEDLPISSDGAFTFATRGPAGFGLLRRGEDAADVDLRRRAP